MKFLVVLTMLVLGGCKGSAPGTCKKDTDCKEGVCVFGKCQECAVDKDCSAGKSCQENKCVGAGAQTCADSSDCGTGMSCEGGICVASAAAAASASSCEMTGTVHFDFNVYELRSGDRDFLSQIASCMRSNSGTHFLIAGNTDERGTVEYNLALGEKRAKAVSQYLQNSGIDGSRMNTVSYGKEKPVNPAHNEEAWAENRRADITIEH